MTDEPNRDRAQDRIDDRKAARAESTESILETVGAHLDSLEYPVSSEEIAAEYATEPIDLPNETESLGSVFDRLGDERYESAEEARQAVYGELSSDVADTHAESAEQTAHPRDERGDP